MFEHADRGDRVERAVEDVPVVLEADLHPVGQAGVGHRLLGPLDLAAGERDPDDRRAVAPGRVQAIPPHPHPTSSSRMPSRRSSFRQISSYLAACASSSVASVRGHTAHE